MFFGLGMLLGPILGAIIYDIGGFPAPFMTFACFYLFFLPIVTYVLILAQREKDKAALEDGELVKVGSSEPTKKDFEYASFLVIPRFTFGLLSFMMMMVCFSYLSPNIANWLKT